MNYWTKPLLSQPQCLGLPRAGWRPISSPSDFLADVPMLVPALRGGGVELPCVNDANFPS